MTTEQERYNTLSAAVKKNASNVIDLALTLSDWLGKHDAAFMYELAEAEETLELTNFISENLDMFAMEDVLWHLR